MKAASRPRMDVNLEELDQIIDGGMRAPLSESHGEKLKAVLHTLAERAKPRWRTTEKTRAVLPPSGSEPSAEKPSPSEPSVEAAPSGAPSNDASAAKPTITSVPNAESVKRRPPPVVRRRTTRGPDYGI